MGWSGDPLKAKARLLLSLLAALCVAVARPASPAQDKSCGPPDYCARTDRRIEPYPETPPALGPAGSIIIDPSFGSRILRVTDAKSDPMGRGRSLMTPASAEQNAWNADTTRFDVLTPGGQYVLFQFDPSSMKIHERGMIEAPLGEPEFSYTRPDILYGVRSRNPAFVEYDVSSSKFGVVNKASDCVQLGPSDLGFTVSVSADDRRMSTVLGPGQDRNFMIYVYDRKLGCRWYNTRTGGIGGQWGPKGTIAATDRFLIHNARMSKSGDSVWIQRGFSTVGQHWLVWDVASMSVVACPSQCSGHHALGYSHIVGPSGERHPMDLLVRPLNSLSEPRPLVSDLQPTTSARYWYDQHFSWNHSNREDTTPVCLSTYSVYNPETPGVPLDTIAPWENEVMCAETDGKGSKVWRFAHTYSTAKNGFWSTPRGNVSQDGRFFMFTSDWQDQLGVRRRDPNHYRVDVFIVELK